MGHTATNVLIHFIFSTHRRAPTITSEIDADLRAYLGGIIRELGGVALSINGTPDHVHLLVRMPSTQSVANVVRLVKTNSSRWIHERWPQVRNFGWQAGYGAFSASESAIEAIRQYISKQRQHHLKRSFQEEFRLFLKRTTSWSMRNIYGVDRSYAPLGLPLRFEPTHGSRRGLYSCAASRLGQRNRNEPKHIAEAIQYRSLDRIYWA